QRLEGPCLPPDRVPEDGAQKRAEGRRLDAIRDDQADAQGHERTESAGDERGETEDEAAEEEVRDLVPESAAVVGGGWTHGKSPFLTAETSAKGKLGSAHERTHRDLNRGREEREGGAGGRVARRADG